VAALMRGGVIVIRFAGTAAHHAPRPPLRLSSASVPGKSDAVCRPHPFPREEVEMRRPQRDPAIRPEHLFRFHFVALRASSRSFISAAMRWIRSGARDC